MHQEFNILQKNREAVVKLIADLSLDQLNAIPPGFNNNIIWNMGHMVTVQEMLTYGMSKIPYTIEEFILVNFKKNTRPERSFTQEEVDRVLAAFKTSVLQLEKDYQAGIFVETIPFISKLLETTIEGIEGIIRFNLFHEGLHTGVIQKYIQLLK